MLYAPEDILAGPSIRKVSDSVDSYHLFAQAGMPVVRTFDLHYFKTEQDMTGNLRLADAQGFKVPYDRPVDLSRLKIAAETYNISPDYRDYIASEVPIVTADVPNRNMDCLVGSSLVPTDVGLVPLRDIPQSGAKYVLTPDGPCKIHNWRRVGYLPTVKVTLRDGRTLQGTADHEVLAVDRATLAAVWRPLGELSPSDCVICMTGTNFEAAAPLPPTPRAEQFLAVALEARDDQRYSRTINEITTPPTMTAELARLLGYLVAEGTVTHANTVTFSNNDPALLDDFCHCWQVTFGLTIAPTYESNSGGYAYGSSVLARQWLAALGLGYQRAAKKRVPWAVLRSSKRMMGEFLRAYLAGDGCVGHDTVIMTSASARLLRQLQYLLLGLGVHTTFSREKAAGKRVIRGQEYECRAMWRLAVGRTAAAKLLEQIGALPGAKGQLTVSGATNVDRHEVVPFAKEALQQLVADRRAERDGPRGPYQYRTDKGKMVAAYLSPGAMGDHVHKSDLLPELLDSITKIDTELGHNLAFLCRDDVFAGEVVAVDRAGDEWVYDIGVEQAHRFIANGVVVHNCFSFSELSFYNPLYGCCSYQTFVGKGVHLQHDNQDPKKAKGIILDAAMRKVGHNWHVMILLACDRTKDRQLVEEIVRSPINGWCLTAGTLVSTSKGLVPIESLGHGRKLRHAMPVEGVTVDTPNGPGRVTHWYYSGRKSVIELQTKPGFAVRGSTNQMALILRPNLTTEWVEFKDVTPGMYMALASEPAHAWPEKLSLPSVEVKEDTVEYREPIRCRLCHTDCLSLSSHVRYTHLTSVDDYRRRFRYDGPMAAYTIRNSRPKPVTLPTEMTPALATVLGYLAAEGGVYRIKGYRMTSLSNTDEAIVSDYSDAFEQCFGSAPIVNWTARGAGDHINGVRVKSRKPLANVYFHSETVAEFLTQIAGECVTHDSHHKEVPWAILQAPRASAAAFLRALYLGDGSGRFRSGSLVRSITLHSSSLSMRQQVQLLLLRFGIRSRITDYDERYPDLVVSDTRSMVRFMREIMGEAGFELDYEERVDRLPYFRSNVLGVTEDLLPPCGGQPSASWLRSGAGKELLATLEDKQQRDLRRLLALKCEWVEVTAVDECGEEETFDLTVAGAEGPLSDPSCFPANGLYCHNSMGALVSYTTCLTGSTLVATTRGLIRLDQLDQYAGRVRVPTSYGSTRLLAWKYQGVKDVHQVTTSMGYRLNGTGDHRVRVVNPDLTLGFKQIGDLQSGDWLVLRKGGTPEHRHVSLKRAARKVTATLTGRERGSERQDLRLPEHMTPELAAILGYLGAKGHLRRELLVFTNTDGDYNREFVAHCESVFGLTPRAYSADKLQISRTALMQFLRAIGLARVKSMHKRVPWSVLRADRACQLAYLRAYINGDGHLPQHARTVSISSKSEGMIRDLQTMMLALGYVSYVRQQGETHGAVPTPMWHVYVYGRDAVELAAELNYQATDIWAEQFEQDITPKLEVVPYSAQIVDQLRQDKLVAGNCSYACADGSVQRLCFQPTTTGGNRYKGSRRGNDWTRRNLQQILPSVAACDPEVAERLRGLLDRRLVFDRVDTRLITGQEKVYDVMVAENGHEPEFTAAGFVVHNCSVCGFRSNGKVFCEPHIGRNGSKKGRIFDGRIAYERCHLVNFIETSKVKNPADINAYSEEKLFLAYFTG
jgi:intein/homing endonuclease